MKRRRRGQEAFASFVAIALAVTFDAKLAGGSCDVGAAHEDSRTSLLRSNYLRAIAAGRVRCAWRMRWALTTLRGGQRDENTPPPPGLPLASQSPVRLPTASPRGYQDLKHDANSTEVGGKGSRTFSNNLSDDTSSEQGEGWLRAFACFFSGQWQIIKARRRERFEESEREKEAVREIARLFRKVFAIDDSLDFATFLRGAQQGRGQQCNSCFLYALHGACGRATAILVY